VKEELEQKLFDEFPSFFRGREKGARATLMVFGFMCDDGWYNLIYNLCKDIEKELEKHPELKKQFIVLEVKEKFGGLRFYSGPATEKIFKLIDEAEKKSYKICEICGKRGCLRINRNYFWYKTLCKSCAKDEWVKVPKSKRTWKTFKIFKKKEDVTNEM